MTRNLDKRMHFVATEVGEATEFGILTCGATHSGSTGESHYVIVQANLNDPDEWGPYFEVDDQINGGYQFVQRVQLVESTLEFTLKQGTVWYPNLEQISVNLGDIEAADVESLRKALDKCLKQCELKVEILAVV